MLSPFVAATFGFVAGIVFLALALYIFNKLGHQPGRKAGPVPTEETVSEELIAVLAAAACEALQAPVRLYQVHVHREPEVGRWSRAGRTS